MDRLSNDIAITSKVWGEENISKKIGDIVYTLLKEDEVCLVRKEDFDTYVIEHNYDEDFGYLGGPVLKWLTQEEYEDVLDKRDEDKEDRSEAGEEQSELTYADVTSEFYYESDLIIEEYMRGEVTPEDALQKIISILDRARSLLEYKSDD